MLIFEQDKTVMRLSHFFMGKTRPRRDYTWNLGRDQDKGLKVFFYKTEVSKIKLIIFAEFPPIHENN